MIAQVESGLQPGDRRLPAIMLAACGLSIVVCGFALSSSFSEDDLCPVEEPATAELLRAPQTEEVCIELLSRELRRDRLVSTLQRLARIRRTTPLQVLCQTTENLHDASETRIRNLTTLFTELSRSRREQVALLSQQRFRLTASSRRVATGVVATLQEDAVRLLQAAETDAERIEILRSLTDVPSSPVRRVLYRQVYGVLIGGSFSQSVRRCAVETAAELDSDTDESPPQIAEDFIRLLVAAPDDEVKTAVFTALARMDASCWPQNQIRTLASEYIAWLARVPRENPIPNLARHLADVLPADGRRRFSDRVDSLTGLSL